MLVNILDSLFQANRSSTTMYHQHTKNKMLSSESPGLPLFPLLKRSTSDLRNDASRNLKDLVLINSHDQEKSKIWLKPRSRSVHPKQQEPLASLKRPKDEEIALSFSQNGFRLSDKDAFSTPISSRYLSTPNTSKLPSLHTPTGSNRAGTIVTLKPRIPSSRRVTSVERRIIQEKANTSSSIEIMVCPELPSAPPKTPYN